jgi:3-(3-hydroxy-phenyl)propionate hydroxylase
MTKATRDVDILIVGAGPTGLLLSHLLGGMGVQTLLVERNPSTVDEPRAVSIDDESMRALQAAGLDAVVQEITTKGYGSVYFGPDGKPFAEVKPSLKEYGFDKRNAFEQPEFEARLRTALARHDTVVALFGTDMTGFEQDEAGVTATLVKDGDKSLVHAKYMVACDGGRSSVRKHLGIELEGSSFKEPWLIVDLKSTKNRGFHTEVFCDPRRSAISLPGPNGIRRYEFKLNPGETAALANTERFARTLLRRVGPDEDQPIRRQRVYTFHARVASKWRVGRVFLAGDAAHLTPPFAGQGMNSGLRDAHNLAWKLDEALRRTDADELLDSYQTERKPHAWSMIELALRMGRVMMPTSTQMGALIRSGFRLLGCYPPARDFVAQMKYKPKPQFTTGLLRISAGANAQDLVGRMIPQPLVADVSRNELLLDRVLPDRPVALVFAERPDEALASKDAAQLVAAGAVVIGLTPEWINAVTADFQVFRDKGRLLTSGPFAKSLGHILLLRRDRYVAAIEPVATAAALLPILQKLTHRPQEATVAEHTATNDWRMRAR